jgi:hypothetical protein
MRVRCIDCTPLLKDQARILSAAASWGNFTAIEALFQKRLLAENSMGDGMESGSQTSKWTIVICFVGNLILGYSLAQLFDTLNALQLIAYMSQCSVFTPANV